MSRAAAVLLTLRRPKVRPPTGDDPLLDTDYVGFNERESRRRGIDPAVSARVWNSEGSLTEPAREGDFSGPPWFSGRSWWAPQLHYGGVGPEPWQDYRAWGHTAGMGNGFTATTGWQPGDPRAWRDAIRVGLDHVKRYGWGAWYGAAANGITGFQGVDQSTPWNGTPANEWDYPRFTGRTP